MEIPPEPAITPEDADARYKIAVDHDPFPKIPSALLNGADVYDYVRATGMILPFDETRLKAASYEVAIGNRYIYWDGKGEIQQLGEEDKLFTLNPNSIAFVTTHEEFRLPSYIAARFNLRINNVHRGILLGTGPLVDPGFVGHLLIPLHNLTTNTYTFKPGEKFAWFEFTKISPNQRWFKDYEKIREEYGLRGTYKPFPRAKQEREPTVYFQEALEGVKSDAIQSSIPQSIVRAESSAREAQESAREAAEAAQRADGAARSLRNWVTGLGIAAGIVVLISLGSVVLTSLQLIWQTREAISANQADLARMTGQLDERFPQLRTEIGLFANELNRTTSLVEQLRDELAELRSTLPAMRDSEDEP